jgi:hypothetical protein
MWYPKGYGDNQGWYKPATTALALTIDGFADGSGGTTTQTLTLTTTKTDDILVLYVQVNDTTVSTVTSSGLTWTRRATVFSGGVSTVDEWYAVAASPLASHVITITYAGTASFSIATVFAVNGGKTSAPYDVNGSLPGTSAGGSTFSTTATNTMIVYGCATLGSVPSGYTAIHHELFWSVGYKVVSSAQSSVTVPFTDSPNPCVIDALVLGP